MEIKPFGRSQKIDGSRVNKAPARHENFLGQSIVHVLTKGVTG